MQRRQLLTPTQVNTERLNYIKAVGPIATVACIGMHLFPSIMIAQAALESGNGKSLLAAKYNNHFGIKASKGWKGKTADLPTSEVVSGKSVKVKAAFRAYDNIYQGFDDRVNFLRVNPRYAKAGVFTAQTPEEQAHALLRAGYATDPAYPQKLITIINTYDLKKFDKQV